MAKRPFDLRTHVRNTKGKVVSVQPYKMICEGDKRFFVRDGEMYLQNGEHVGKWEGKASYVKPDAEKDALRERIAELENKLKEQNNGKVSKSSSGDSGNGGDTLSASKHRGSSKSTSLNS